MTLFHNRAQNRYLTMLTSHSRQVDAEKTAPNWTLGECVIMGFFVSCQCNNTALQNPKEIIVCLDWKPLVTVYYKSTFGHLVDMFYIKPSSDARRQQTGSLLLSVGMSHVLKVP